ncbi:MAG: hypothetical protein ABS82_08175 [Rhodanobacter sp. SCN 67-45]|nr:MAG: hypothetical protein ABS82_08175 [Rhodanobacter sp. SCN 67-45]
MKNTRPPLMLAVSLAAALALSACGKGNESASPVPSNPPPSGTAAAPPLAPPAFPPPAASTGMTGMTGGDTAGTVSFSSLEVGSSVDTNHKIVAAGTSFAPKDTIYASVETIGPGHAKLTASWHDPQGRIVHEDSKELDAMGPATTAFMISQPEGFPEGNYKIDISLDGRAVASKDFSVKR